MHSLSFWMGLSLLLISSFGYALDKRPSYSLKDIESARTLVKPLRLKEAILHKKLRHVCQVALIAPVWDSKEIKANSILMLARWDGTLGLPGGYVDPHESLDNVHLSCQRELTEEIGVTSELVPIAISDHFSSSVYQDNLMIHLFAKQIKADVFRKIENLALKAKDREAEVLGTVRAPLYNLEDGRGFPRFLENNFIGNTKSQLLLLIHEYNLMPELR